MQPVFFYFLNTYIYEFGYILVFIVSINNYEPLPNCLEKQYN